MIPLKLTLSGLYSYQREQSIDFEPLLKSGLFGIFGSVGSGKSTILEAITFALYRKTERLSRNDGINYNMMNLKSDRMKIDFECLNHQNERWRFIVEGKRNGKRFDDVKFDATRIFKQFDGGWQAVEGAKVEEIIGLSYDNFRRTIIIPQGQFQEFLELGNADRTKMLEEIFGLHRFDLRQQAGRLLRDTEQELAGLDGELKRYQTVDAEAIARQQAEAEEKEKQLAAQREKRDTAKEKAEAAGKLLAKVQQHDELKQQQEALQEQRQEIQEKEAGLKRYESCRDQFSGLVSEVNRLGRQLHDHQAAFSEARQAETALREEARALEAEKQRQANAPAQQEKLKKQLSEYQTLRELLQVRRRHTAAEAQLKQLRDKAASARKRMEDARQQKDELRQQIREVKAEMPDAARLSELQQWFQKQELLQEALRELRAEQQEKQQDRQALEAELAKKAAQWQAHTELRISAEAARDAGRAARELSTEWKRLSGQRDELQDTLSEQKAHHKLEEFARELEDGKACPLCGATAHPAPLESGAHAAAIQTSETSLSRLKTLLETLNTLSQDCRLLENNITQVAHDLRAIATQVCDKEAALKTHQAGFTWQDYSPDRPEDVRLAQQRGEQLKRRLQTLEQQLEEAEETIARAEPEQRETGAELERLRQEIAGLLASEEHYANQLTMLNPQRYAGSGADAIPREEAQLQQKIEELEAAQYALQEREKNLHRQLTIAESNLAFTRQALEKTQQEQAGADEQLRTRLSASAFETLDEVRQLLDNPPDTEAVREEISMFQQRWTAVNTRLETLEQDLDGRHIRPEEVEQAMAEAEALNQACEQLLTEADAARRTLGRMEEELQQRQELEQQKEACEEQKEQLKTMTRLFDGRGFVNYISSVYLRQLCEAANGRFHRLTKQQLRLELDADNGFRVRDYLYGGQVRSVKTLSGGQTFQASLCLALALAESVQQGSKTAQNFFFLDEGFGSLDQETLAVVFETLKSLRKEQRVVGVISHVEALQQEMDVYLKIKNEGESGSVIYESWR